ncbi:hypothetical protein XENOCAPTIV_013708 [Xenoophorus captivus]|uniref:Plexin cytoplasmic RasGAP domain-containing protein n=1 Tax=Xenoophorus captivus TaxID=1517983 RepID=A0ABV0RM60_9TELE
MISKNKFGKVSLFVVSSYCCSVSCSGKRKVTLIGTHLDLVDSVTHINGPQEVILPRNSSSQLDERCQTFSKLIQDQLFLTTMVHALEEQKSFTIKDKCSLASLITVALHSNLSYLTEVMEVLLKDLMQRSSNTQPKLLLRRTESTVEKLLTNWVSVCLYGFLRVCCPNIP